jgi:tetratricopeptide (TPR) repeat protein
MRRASAHLENKQYASALRELEPLLSGPDTRMDVLVLAARAAVLSKDRPRARKLARRLLSHRGANSDARAPYYAGMVKSSLGAFEKAVPLYEKALAIAPKHGGARRELVRALSFLARRANQRRDFVQAVRLMGQARKLEPKSHGIDWNLATIYLRAGQPRDALSTLERLLRRNPNDPRAHRLLGRAYLALGKRSKAEVHMARAVTASQVGGGAVAADAFLDHAVVLARLGKPERAMVDLKLAANIARSDQPGRKVEIQRRLARVQVLLAIRKLRHGSRKEAWKHLEWALAASAGLPLEDRNVVQAAVILGAVATGKANEARQMTRRLKVQADAILDPGYASAGNQLLAAYVDYVAEDPKSKLRAGAIFERLATQNASPRHQSHLWAMARSAFLEAADRLYQTGAIVQAKRAHDRVLRRLGDPAPAALHNAAVLDYYTGNQVTAITALRAIRAKAPMASCNLAVHHERVYMLQKAYELFRECKKRGGQFPDLDQILKARQRVYGVSALHQRLGRKTSAAGPAAGLGVGLCAPELPFTGAVERHRLVKAVAQHLARGLGRPVEGLAYINPRDLRRDIRSGKLHFAIVGALFAATVPEDQILAQARLSSSEGAVWTVLAPTLQDLKALKGKRLQIPSMGPSTLKFVQNGVLGGKLKVTKYFKVQWSPDLLSANQAVRLNRADAVVAPIFFKDLIPAAKGYEVPPPAFVVVDRQMPQEMVTKARAAVLSYGASIATVGSWYAANAGEYRELAVFAGRTEFRMVLIPGKKVVIKVGELLKQDVLLPRMPELNEPLWVP